MTSQAQVTVLMAVHNGEEYLKTALDSLLKQTYAHFILLVVDDGSTDSTRQIIESTRDPRIRLLSLERNVGQTAALNRGLREADTPWIARMDADDFSAPTRLEEQMGALRQYPNVGCVGTGIWEFRQDPAQPEAIILRPQHHREIWQAELLGCGLIHGTILANRQALLSIGGYDERFRYASDRVLFHRLLRRVQAYNLQRPLMGLRRHPHQDSFSFRAAEEYVQVFTEAIAEGALSSHEMAILRGSLAYAHLFRAKGLRQAGKTLPAWRDGFQAFWFSPRTALRHALGPVAKRFLSHSLVDRLGEKRLGVRYEIER